MNRDLKARAARKDRLAMMALSDRKVPLVFKGPPALRAPRVTQDLQERKDLPGGKDRQAR